MPCEADERIERRLFDTSLAHGLEIDGRGSGGAADYPSAAPCSASRNPNRTASSSRTSEAPTFEVREDLRPAADHKREVHGRGLARGFGLRLVEVGVPIE